MSTQSHDLHRSLLRPFILQTLRAAGFNSTKPSLLDTLVNLAEHHLLLLATTTAAHAQHTHHTPVPTLADIRLAFQTCGVLAPSAHETWTEILRRPVETLGPVRSAAEKRKRDDADLEDVRGLQGWFEGREMGEVRRIGGLEGGGVGVGGEKVVGEGLLEGIRRRGARGGDVEGWERLGGTVLGKEGEREVEGMALVREWEERVRGRGDGGEGGVRADSVRGVVAG